VKLDRHPTYSLLSPAERELARLLVESEEQRELLPFRAPEQTPAKAVVVAAETRMPKGGILLVAPGRSLAAAWEAIWGHRGQQSLYYVPEERPSAAGVTIMTLESLGWYEEEIHSLRYRLVILGGGVEHPIADEDADYVRQVNGAATHFWRLAAQGFESSWPTGQPGRLLVNEIRLGALSELAFSPGALRRPSGLAERVAA
jgi:hypothetical protein